MTACYDNKCCPSSRFRAESALARLRHRAVVGGHTSGATLVLRVVSIPAVMDYGAPPPLKHTLLPLYILFSSMRRTQECVLTRSTASGPQLPTPFDEPRT